MVWISDAIKRTYVFFVRQYVWRHPYLRAISTLKYRSLNNCRHDRELRPATIAHVHTFSFFRRIFILEQLVSLLRFLSESNVGSGTYVAQQWWTPPFIWLPAAYTMCVQLEAKTTLLFRRHHEAKSRSPAKAPELKKLWSSDVYPDSDKDNVHPAILHAHWMHELKSQYGEAIQFIGNQKPYNC